MNRNECIEKINSNDGAFCRLFWKKDGSRCGFFNDSNTFIIIPKHLKVYLCNKYYIYNIEQSILEIIKERQLLFITKVNPDGLNQQDDSTINEKALVRSIEKDGLLPPQKLTKI